MRSRKQKSAISMATTFILLVMQGPFAFAQGRSWNFDADAIGRHAPGLTDMTGLWRVAEDTSAPSGARVLAQLAANTGSTFNVVLVDDVNFQDVDVSVQLRAVAGAEDQGGGVVWRAQDADNYYVARYNPLEDNFRVYSVKGGKRRMLEGVTANVERAGWHPVRVSMSGDYIECYLDGTKVMEVHDKTFAAGGSVGLWTKADAQTHFDDFAAYGASQSLLFQ